jgi:hypothetical protein
VTQDSRIAWLAVATHVVASAAMLLLLREGLPPASDAERIAFIATHRAGWTAGWLTWQLAVVSLVALYAVLARRLGGPLPLPALALGTAGAAIDIATNVRYIVVLPRLGGDAFALLDRELEAMTGYAANGLYTLAFVLFAIAGRCVMPRLANVLAVPVALSGFALAIGALLHDARTELVSSAILFPLFTLWTILIARWLRSE